MLIKSTTFLLCEWFDSAKFHIVDSINNIFNKPSIEFRLLTKLTFAYLSRYLPLDFSKNVDLSTKYWFLSMIDLFMLELENIVR